MNNKITSIAKNFLLGNLILLRRNCSFSLEWILFTADFVHHPIYCVINDAIVLYVNILFLIEGCIQYWKYLNSQSWSNSYYVFRKLMHNLPLKTECMPLLTQWANKTTHLWKLSSVWDSQVGAAACCSALQWAAMCYVEWTNGS